MYSAPSGTAGFVSVRLCALVHTRAKKKKKLPEPKYESAFHINKEYYFICIWKIETGCQFCDMTIKAKMDVIPKKSFILQGVVVTSRSI